jgi:uncharacterized protein (DUF433 family)
MMIPRNRSTWQQGPHLHRGPRRLHAKLEGWPEPKAPMIVSERQGDRAYPETMLKIFEKAMTRCPGISTDKDVMQGQPCVFGTRIPVRSVLRVLEQNVAADDVKKSYPHLTTQQIEDVLYFSQIILELPRGLDETAVVA